MIYLDTSFLVPLHAAEETSTRVEVFLREQPSGGVMVSRWPRTEFASTLARNVRTKVQAEGDARALMGAFERDLAASFNVYTPVAEDFDVAARLLLERPASGLRGADALHLAAAKQQRVPPHTLDKTLLRAAEAFGVPASDAGIGAP